MWVVARWSDLPGAARPPDAEFAGGEKTSPSAAGTAICAGPGPLGTPGAGVWREKRRRLRTARGVVGEFA